MGRLQTQHLDVGYSQAPALQLGSDIVTASDHVRVLEVTFSSGGAENAGQENEGPSCKP